jgi:trans-aconitate methyltransferase
MRAFWVLHSDLPREGPGEAADIEWLSQQINIPSDARICDVACGPGADIAALRGLGAQADVTAIDGQESFIAAAKSANAPLTNITYQTGDMSELSGPYDLIWCAGAVYFLGIEKALSTWRSALSPSGRIAFSEPCYFTDTPSKGAQAFWEGEGAITNEAGIKARIEAAGYELIATRKLSDAAWENYYTPMEARIEKLRPDADADLHTTLDEGLAEIAGWRAHRAETGYLLCVVKPA